MKRPLTALVFGLLIALISFPVITEAQVVQVIPLRVSSTLTIKDGATTASSATPVAINSTAGNIFGLIVDAGSNTNGTDVYVNFFNATPGSVTPGTTAALFSVKVTNQYNPSRVVVPIGSPISIPYSVALSANCTTTKNGATPTTSACNFIEVHK